MCIISVYEKGKSANPDKKTLERMIKGNPDGIGCAWNDGAQIHFRKGLKTAEDVLTLFDSINDNYQTFIFHARIATSGGVSAQKCHPFLVAGNNTALNLTTYDGARPCAFHNGIFRIAVEEGLNDTQTLIKTMVDPLRKHAPRALYNGEFNAIIKTATFGSRFVLMYPDRVYLFGDWQKSEGVHYSNGGFRELPKPRYTWTPTGCDFKRSDFGLLGGDYGWD